MLLRILLFLVILKLIDSISSASDEKLIEVYPDLDKFCQFNICRNIIVSNENEQMILNRSLGHKNSLDFWTFEDCVLTNFPKGIFDYQQPMLLLMENNSIKTLGPFSFLNANKLETLFLGQNKIEEIPSRIFRDASNLEAILLGFNRISKLSANSFEGLSQLWGLDLSGNQIQTLPEAIFASLPLTKLNLTSNKLTSLPAKLFENNKSLMELYLGDNDLQNIDPKLFQNINETSQIDLSNNIHLKILDLHVRSSSLKATNCGLTNVSIYSVKDLDLSGNSISSNALTVHAPETLEVLNLSKNSLNSIKFLKPFTNLRHLYLNDNPEIKSLDEDFTMPSLVELSISNIGLTQFPSEFVKSLKLLNFLDISRNQIKQIEPSNCNMLSKLLVFLYQENPMNYTFHTVNKEFFCTTNEKEVGSSVDKLLDRSQGSNGSAVEQPVGNDAQCTCQKGIHELKVKLESIEATLSSLVKQIGLGFKDTQDRFTETKQLVWDLS